MQQHGEPLGPVPFPYTPSIIARDTARTYPRTQPVPFCGFVYKCAHRLRLRELVYHETDTISPIRSCMSTPRLSRVKRPSLNNPSILVSVFRNHECAAHLW